MLHFLGLLEHSLQQETKSQILPEFSNIYGWMSFPECNSINGEMVLWIVYFSRCMDPELSTPIVDKKYGCVNGA